MQIKAAIEASLQDIETTTKSNCNDTQLDQDLMETSQVELKDDWKNYLGSDDSPKFEIVMRYPDGKRENTIFSSTSKMKVYPIYVYYSVSYVLTLLCRLYFFMSLIKATKWTIMI